MRFPFDEKACLKVYRVRVGVVINSNIPVIAMSSRLGW